MAQALATPNEGHIRQRRNINWTFLLWEEANISKWVDKENGDS